MATSKYPEEKIFPVAMHAGAEGVADAVTDNEAVASMSPTDEHADHPYAQQETSLTSMMEIMVTYALESLNKNKPYILTEPG